MNRRELLQFFGIGATITPMVCGAPVVQAAAKLLAVPNVEILKASSFPNGHAPELFADRLKWNPYEAIWLYMWQIENNPPWSVNFGMGTLEHILGRVPTDAEKAACAGIMQWFGTNCGHCFIEEALRVSGYRVTHENTPQADAIRSLQYSNIRSKPHGSVRISYRGREIELKPGYAEVVR